MNDPVRVRQQGEQVMAAPAAADDVQRMLLCCILRDAIEGQYAAEEACPDCRAGSIPCVRHWDAHEGSGRTYSELQVQLERYAGLPYGTAFPLTAQVQRVISAALNEAIAFRSAGQAIEDLALMAAYRLLRREFAPAAANVGAAVGMTA